tara:strand:- start:385 stop:1233 length:849 start_codon:yes stop_codon:yes gene_type:complete
MKNLKYTLVLGIVISILLSSSVLALGDLTIELGEPEFLAREGFGQQILLPYTITNIGDEPVTSRLGIKAYGAEGETQGYPLYVFTGEVQMQLQGEDSPIEYEGVPVTLADGSIEYRQAEYQDIYQNDGLVSNAPTITLEPQESVVFEEEYLMTVFSLSESQEYTIGFEVDYANEVDESNEDNNIALTTIDVTVNTFVQGPNEQFGLDEDEYWFYFNEYGDCLSLDVPEPTQFCLVSDGPFVSKLLVNNEEVKLYHIFSLFSLTANVGNLEIQIGDGFWVSYE